MNKELMGQIEKAHNVTIAGDNNIAPRSKGFHRIANFFTGKTKNYHYDAKASALAKQLYKGK